MRCVSSTRPDSAVVLLRAGVLSAVALVLGAAGHVLADGLLPGPGTLLLILAAILVPNTALLRRPASAARVVTLVVGGQTAIHLALTVTAGHAGHPAASAVAPPAPPAPPMPPTELAALEVVDGRRVGNLYDAFSAAEQARLATTVDGGGAGGLGHLVDHLVTDLTAHAWMAVAHLVAAVLVGLWLALGERALWTLLALLARVILACLSRAAIGVGTPPPVRARYAAHPDRAVLDVDRLARSVVRRGPPALLAVRPVA